MSVELVTEATRDERRERFGAILAMVKVGGVTWADDPLFLAALNCAFQQGVMAGIMKFKPESVQGGAV